MSTRRQRAHRQAFGVGLLATVLMVVLYAGGLLDWLELRTLDLRFRYANSIGESPDIVCIDIDDDSLEIIRRWPWPRDIQAGLIDVLREAGLKTLLCDIEFVEPEPLRPIVPRNADILTNPLDLSGSSATVAYPDHELRRSIAALGRVYLAFHYETAPQQSFEDQPLPSRIRQWLSAEPSRWHAPPESIFEQLFQEIVGGDEWRREELVVALRNVLSYQATLRDPILPLEAAEPIAETIPALSPVYFPHARAAKRCGFVVYEPDVDGVMRRMRVLVQHDGRVLPQLAFAVAFDELGLTAEDVSAAPGRLTLRLPNDCRKLTIQLDDDGHLLVPWVPKPRWTEQFGKHVPIDAVWQVYDRRLAIRDNQRYMVDLLAELLATGRAEQWRQYHDDLKRRLELESELRLARYKGDDQLVARISDWLSQYRTLLHQDEPRLRSALDELAPDADPALTTLRRAFAANDAYRREIDATMQRLTARVGGKIGVLGYTATSLADMTPTPINHRTPGVVAHANLLSGLLTGRTVSWAPISVNALAAAAFGVIASIVSVRWRPRAAAVLLLALGMAWVVLAGWMAFFLWTCWIGLVPALLAPAAAYFFVLMYRYVFLERESRQIAAALGQYTSATLARQMAEDAELCKRAEMRDVTAMFTDLAGFTAISERIGAERTQAVLNATLGRLSDVMLRYEGMVNKFIGDGIFAFWNPVIYPQPDHAQRACECAVDLQRALRELIAEQRRGDGDEVFGDLVLRIGVATGNAIVGPCGSEQKYDYTCIGDSVNVAARLESANKFYGTRILVSGATLEQAGTSFASRSLGGVRVKGKSQAVPIYELLGRVGDVDADTLEHAQRFAEGVAAFQQRHWVAAESVFESCLAQRPSDLAAERYLQAVRRYQTAPPAADWTAALELMEK